MEQEEYENWYSTLTHTELDIMLLLRAQQSKTKDYVSGLRASLKQVRDDNTRLKLEVHALKHRGNLVANDSLADIQVSETQNPRLLADAFDAKVQLERELSHERRRNNELEKMNRAYQKSIDELARKRAEDRRIIQKWKQRLDELQENDDINESSFADDNESLAVSGLKRRRIEGTQVKTLTQAHNEQNLFVETAPSQSEFFEQGELGEELKEATRGETDKSNEEGEDRSRKKNRFMKPTSLNNPTVAASSSVFDLPNQLRADSIDMEARGIPNLVSSPLFSSSPNKNKRALVNIKQEEIEDDENDIEEIKTFKRKPLVRSSPPIEFTQLYEQDKYQFDDEATYSPSRASKHQKHQQQEKQQDLEREEQELADNAASRKMSPPPAVMTALQHRKKNMRIFGENEIDSQLLVTAADSNNISKNTTANNNSVTKNEGVNDKSKRRKGTRSTLVSIATPLTIPNVSTTTNSSRKAASAVSKIQQKTTKAQHRQELHDQIEQINSHHELVEYLKKQTWELDDFQVNGRYNGQGGLRHAYKESFRGQRRKDCVPGQCDCENCIEFHRLATTSVNDTANINSTLNGKSASVRREAVWNSNSIAQQRAGGDSTEISGGKTNNKGNSRTFWGRPKSPPGFWRSDFPSTQETREERLQVQERQRIEVAARLEEALITTLDGSAGPSASGRFVFRDARVVERLMELSREL